MVEQYSLEFLPILPRLIAEITEFISSKSGIRLLAVYKRASNFLSSNTDFLTYEQNQSEANATNEDKIVQHQIKLIKQKVEENLQIKDFKAALIVLTSIVDPINQFLDSVQVNCEDNSLRSLRYSLLNQICQMIDKIVVFSELEKK